MGMGTSMIFQRPIYIYIFIKSAGTEYVFVTEIKESRVIGMGKSKIEEQCFFRN